MGAYNCKVKGGEEREKKDKQALQHSQVQGEQEGYHTIYLKKEEEEEEKKKMKMKMKMMKKKNDKVVASR